MPASGGPDISARAGGRSLAAIVVTFGSVGATATVCYFLIATALVALPWVSSTAASVGAYLISAAISYFGHKHLSFASKRENIIAAPRFLVTTTAGLVIAYVVARIGDGLLWPAVISYAAVCVVIPVVNFFLLGRWVFGGSVSGRFSASDIRVSPFPILVALAVLVIGVAAYVFNAWRWGTNPDTSWLITVVERIGQGERLYSDIIELNPPFSIWLYLPPVRLAEHIGVSAEGVVRLYTLLICFAGTALAGWMLACSGMLRRRTSMVVAVILFAISVLASGNGFGERDQIGAVIALPLFILAAWRAGAGAGTPPRFRHWAVCGMGAGVLAMVKPYYAVMVIAAAIWLAFKRRDLRVLLLPEFVLSGLITLAYLALSYALYPVFFETVMPLLRDTYMAYRQDLGTLLWIALPWLGLPLVYAVLRPSRHVAQASDILMIAAISAWIPFFIQGKGWPYHAYAATFYGAASLVVCLAFLLEEGSFKVRGRRIAVVFLAVIIAHLRFWPSEKSPAALVAAAFHPGERPTVGMLGGGIETGHPLARMIDGNWIEPYCSDWIAVYAARRARTTAGTAEAARFEAMKARYFLDKKKRLARHPPQILIVDADGALASEMVHHFGFDTLLARYVRIAAEGGTELYRLARNTD